jgi:hypothetical protein
VNPKRGGTSSARIGACTAACAAACAAGTPGAERSSAKKNAQSATHAHAPTASRWLCESKSRESPGRWSVAEASPRKPPYLAERTRRAAAAGVEESG